MKKIFVVSTAALLFVAFSPAQSRAEFNSPQSSYGYGWFKGMALNSCPGIHFQGPLYNYGPYYGGPGYQNMFVTNPYHGGYAPAYSSTYQGLPGNFPTQWQSINPGVPAYPFAATGSSGDYYNAAAHPSVGPYPPMSGQPAFPHDQNIATPSAPQSIESAMPETTPARTTSYRSLRSRLQR